MADLRFYDRSKKIDFEKTVSFVVPITDDIISVNWDEAVEILPNEDNYKKQRPNKIVYSTLPSSAIEKKNYPTWEKFFKDHLVSEYFLEVYHSPLFKVTSDPYENIRDFKIRLGQITREKRDEAVNKLKEKYARRVQTLQGRIHRAEERIEREKSQSSQQKISTAISIGSTILGALFGRKKISTSTISKAGTAMRSAGKVMKESGDIQRAEENLIRLNEQMEQLQDKLQDQLDQLQDEFDMNVDQLEVIKIRPAKTKISVKLFNFLWIPTAEEPIEDIEELKLV